MLTIVTTGAAPQADRPPRFSGRGAVLEEIRDRLLAGGADGGRLVLTGLPGVGKTQIALEYVYRFAASYDVVWWIAVALGVFAAIANMPVKESAIPRAAPAAA